MKKLILKFIGGDRTELVELHKKMEKDHFGNIFFTLRVIEIKKYDWGLRSPEFIQVFKGKKGGWTVGGAAVPVKIIGGER